MTTPLPFLILRTEEARGLVSAEDAIAATEAAWRDYGVHRGVLSRPSSHSLRGEGCVFKVKGGVLPSQGVAGFRLVADAPRDDGGEDTQDWFWLADPRTGRPVALIEEFWLHLLRTTATGALAARMLARPGCRVAAIIGAGRIAAEMLAPLRAALPGIEEIRVSARRSASADAFVAQHATACPGLRAAPSVREAVAGADLVLTMTAAMEPFLDASMPARGATVIGLGDIEMAPDMLTSWADRFVLDDLDFATVAGSVSGWIASGAMDREQVAARLDADVGELATGAKPGRRDPSENVLAIVQGMAICDLALAAAAHRAALARGLGLRLDLGMPGLASG